MYASQIETEQELFNCIINTASKVKEKLSSKSIMYHEERNVAVSDKMETL